MLRSVAIDVAVLSGQVAVGSMMLLSNLEGRLGTSEILGGYLSFYQPTAETGPGAVPLPVATGKR